MRNHSTYTNEPLSNEQLQQMVPSAFAIQPYSSTSEKYTFVPTVQVIDGLRGAGFFPYSAVQSRTRVAGREEYTKHVIRFRSTRENLSVGDNFFETVLTNGHDGSSAYILDGGIFRLACLNGMSVSEATIEFIRIRHIGDIINEVVTSAERLIEQAPKVIDALRTWKSIELTRPEQLLLAEKVREVRYDDLAMAPQAAQLLETRRTEDQPNDLWTTVNVLQENAVRGGVIPRDEHNSRIFAAQGQVTNRFADGARRVGRTREIKDLNFSSKVNKAIWSLGAEFAKLKANA